MGHQLNLNIDELAEGEVKEKIDRELERIAENVLDMNTEADKARSLTIKIDFKPNERRSELHTNVSVSSKLQPVKKAETTFLIGRDFDSGFLGMNELVSGNPGQTFFDPEDSKLKTDIGEDIDDIEAAEEKRPVEKDQIIDFNQRKVKGE